MLIEKLLFYLLLLLAFCFYYLCSFAIAIAKPFISAQYYAESIIAATLARIKAGGKKKASWFDIDMSYWGKRREKIG